MVSEPRKSPLPDAAPPVWARIVAVSSIVIGGACGGLIGWSVVNLQCTEDCSSTAALSGLGGALIGAIGVAVVAVLTLRAMAEWKAIENRDRARRARGLS
jgi:hypothetical protein